MSHKLLVIEDSRSIARIIQKIAMSLGFEVTIAADFKEVKEIIKDDNNFFAATIDYSLPDAPNGEAIPYILSKGIPGIAFTGKMDEETRQEILKQPVIDYIPKENSQTYNYLKRILECQLTNSMNSILVVDDSLAYRNYIVELLERRNFTVYTAKQGQEALDVLTQQPNVKLVITDLEMPVMDGITLSNEIRKNFSREELTIIGISGAKSVTNAARFIKNGADDFLRKPFCPEEFYCRVSQNIENINNIERIQYAANTDYLTDLPNRRAFFNDAQSNVEYYIENQTSYCLAVLDIDFFKKVNDIYGHDAGDHVLKVFSQYLKKHLGNALLSRLGGEEFSVLISGSSKEQLYKKLDVFREKIASSPALYQDNEINYSVSMGVIFNSQKQLTHQMIEADEALYIAKANGRNQIFIAE